MLGFGTPSANNAPINFSILDMHGFNDDIIPYNEESVWCYGLGPRGTLISRDGYYYEDKISYVQIWAVFMNCMKMKNHTSLIMMVKMNFDVLKENVAAMLAIKQRLSSDVSVIKPTIILFLELLRRQKLRGLS